MAHTGQREKGKILPQQNPCSLSAESSLGSEDAQVTLGTAWECDSLRSPCELGIQILLKLKAVWSFTSLIKAGENPGVQH